MAAYQYWQHFLALEADFASTARYVELSKQNFATFSVEYAKLLLAIGSEVDVLCKVICEKIDSAARRGNINDYRTCITAHSQIASESVYVRRYGLDFTPWAAWASGRNPDWWRSYNNVKHERDSHFHEANLEHCSNAIAGLFVAVLYCHKAENSMESLEPYPVLLGRDQEPGYVMQENDYFVLNFT